MEKFKGIFKLVAKKILYYKIGGLATIGILVALKI